jgi:PadR family transcriptional regulator PadR
MADVQLPRMTLSTLAILSAMLEEPNASYYGLELSSATGVKTGVLYPTLARLEQAKILESEWEHGVEQKAVGRPKRRYYRLTGAGQRIAAEVVAEQRQRLTPGKGRAARRRRGLSKEVVE